MSGILVRIMVGMLVRLLVGMYASNVDHTDTALRSTVELRQQCRHPWQLPYRYHAKTHPQNFLETPDFKWFSGRKRWFQCSDSKTEARKCQKCCEILENQRFQDDSHGFSRFSQHFWQFRACVFESEHRHQRFRPDIYGIIECVSSDLNTKITRLFRIYYFFT